jgi:ketohexokinase
MHVLGVGVATLDMIDTLATYPGEDTEQRSLARRFQLGGNAANTLVTLRQLGEQCSWAGTLANDRASEQVIEALQDRGIDYRWAQRYAQGSTPMSHILHNRSNGSRTIVHHRELPEFSAEAFAAINLSSFDWLHFEARNTAACQAMLKDARRRHAGVRISLEVEKVRAGVEALFPLVDVLIFSRAFAQASGHRDDPQGLLTVVRRKNPAALLFCAWGEAGAWLLAGEGPILHSPAYRPAQVVDTLGAGDVFNAGVIHGLLQGMPPVEVLRQALELAGRKCGRLGLQNLVDADV